MVYTRKPARGCQSCREQKLRCDQKEPSCTQCESRQRPCPSYRNEFDLIFMDASPPVINKAANPRQRQTRDKPPLAKTAEDVNSIPKGKHVADIHAKEALRRLNGSSAPQVPISYDGQTYELPYIHQQDEEDPAFSRLTCRSICIGQWRCVAQNGTYLNIYYSSPLSLMTYSIISRRDMCRIQFPFADIKKMYLDTVAKGIVIELYQAPSFSMATSQSRFLKCGDFTEDQQASLAMTHLLGGDDINALNDQLAKLVLLPSFMNRHRANGIPGPHTISPEPEVLRPGTFEAQSYTTPDVRFLRDSLFSEPSAFGLPPFDEFDELDELGLGFGNEVNPVVRPRPKSMLDSGLTSSQYNLHHGPVTVNTVPEVIRRRASRALSPEEYFLRGLGSGKMQYGGTEFRCETCGYYPRGNPKYFKRSLAKHMKRHATEKVRSSSRKAKKISTDELLEDGSPLEPLEMMHDLVLKPCSPRHGAEREEVMSGEVREVPRTVAREGNDPDAFHVVPSGPDIPQMIHGLPETGPDLKDEGVFTDSGYASAPHLNGYLKTESSNENGRSPDPNGSPSATSNLDNDDAATLYSAGTTVAPARAQAYIAEICNDIYSNLKDCVNAETWPVVSKTLPDLIKAFAVRLGGDCPLQVNRDIMYFVHQRHKEVVAQLEAMFGHDTEELLDKSRIILEGMPLLDKMSMWRSRNDQDAAPEVEAEDYFHGVKDDEEQDDHIENIGLSEYQKVISDSQAYKWFLATCKKEVTLQHETTKSDLMTNENIRRSFMKKLPTGTISKRHAPTSYTITIFVEYYLQTDSSLERGAWEPEPRLAPAFSDSVVLTGSLNHAQALTIKQYMSQTWPANGLQMLEAIEDSMKDKRHLPPGKALAAPLHVMSLGSQLVVRASGPAYFIAECAEQLAWLASAVSTFRLNGLCRVTPLANDIMAKEAKSRSSSNRGVCHVDVEFDHSMPPVIRSSWYAVVGRRNLIQGYPIARRPEGYLGLEASLDILLHLVQAKEVSLSPTRAQINGLERSLQLVSRSDNICLWHPVDSMTGVCSCDMAGVVLDCSNLEKGRHILGSCKTRQGNGIYRTNNRPSDGVCQPNTAKKAQSVATLEEIEPCILGRGDPSAGIREPSTSRASRDPALKDHAPATPGTLARNHGGSHSETATDSGDDSFDTDQLSISDASEQADGLDFNNPQDLVLRHVLIRLLKGYRTRQQYPSSAQQSSQGALMSASNFSNSGNGGASNQNNLKRKRSNDNSDDADQDGFQRPPQKKTNCDPAEALKKSFACPFLKKDPVEHRDCCTRKLSRIRDVKQHLARRHTPERYCQLCFETSFADQPSLQNHIRERSCLSQDPSTLEGISYDQRQQLSKKSNPNIDEEGQWFAIWDVLFPETLRPNSAYIDTGLSVEMRLFREYSQTHGPAMLREQIMTSPDYMRQGSSEEEQQIALDRVIAEGITRLFETWRLAQSAGSRPSRNQALNNLLMGQPTPQSSVADSGFATASQLSSLEAGSQIEGSVQSTGVFGMPSQLPATMAVETQASQPTQSLTMGLSDPYDQDWFAPFTSTDNMGPFNANGNDFGFDSTFGSLQGSFEGLG